MAEVEENHWGKMETTAIEQQLSLKNKTINSNKKVCLLIIRIVNLYLLLQQEEPTFPTTQ